MSALRRSNVRKLTLHNKPPWQLARPAGNNICGNDVQSMELLFERFKKAGSVPRDLPSIIHRGPRVMYFQHIELFGQNRNLGLVLCHLRPSRSCLADPKWLGVRIIREVRTRLAFSQTVGPRSS